MTLPPKAWLWLFLLAMVADLAAVYFQWSEARYVTKPLIVLSLLLYFRQRVKTNTRTSLYFTMALLFSLAGDIALLFENRDALFFMLGLGCFLIAHLFYIIAFMRVRGGAKPQWPWIAGTLLYVGILLYVLLPYLGALMIPVIVYAGVLGTMLLAAVHAFPRPYAKPGIICLAGALLFVLSDSILAINKFYMGFPWAGLAIMLTYALAQYMLVRGMAANYSNPNFGTRTAT
ncbi:MAG TPA: lysoplasmalogenase [Chitinophagaceae bacterium]|nr:lysoplasmalogenase [Chitinophagaceae bacterium]